MATLRCLQCGQWVQLHHWSGRFHIIRDIAHINGFVKSVIPYWQLQDKYNIIPARGAGFIYRVPDTKMYMHTCFIVYKDLPGSPSNYFAAALPQSKDLHLYHGYDNFKDAAILFYNMTKRFAQ